MNISECRIGQVERCSSTGCEWRKAFGLRSSTIKCTPGYPIKKVEEKSFKQTKVENFESVNESKNEFKIASQDDWIKKIKVKL